MIMENIHTIPTIDCLTDSCQASTQPAAVFVDLADTMRAYAEAMYIAFQMGQERAGMDMLATTTGTTEPQLLPDKGAAFEMGREKARDDLLYGATGSPQIPPSYEAAIIGVYDSEAYGVYTDMGKYQSSFQYWKRPITQTFASYDEALRFARDGVANALGIAASEVTPMEHPENWRQKVYRR